jgi:type IV pilus assembly protein PilE
VKNPVQKTGGFTLIEMMIVIVVVAILVGIALPAYQNQIRKTKRALGRGELLEVMARQEQYFVNNRQYAVSLVSLGSTNPYSIDADGNEVATDATDRIYTIQLVSPTTTTYTLQAVPQLAQAEDSFCGTLQITSTGVKSESGSGDTKDCW